MKSSLTMSELLRIFLSILLMESIWPCWLMALALIDVSWCLRLYMKSTYYDGSSDRRVLLNSFILPTFNSSSVTVALSCSSNSPVTLLCSRSSIWKHLFRELSIMLKNSSHSCFSPIFTESFYWIM